MKKMLFGLSMALVASGCGISQELYDAQGNELKKAQAELDAKKKACDDDTKKRDDEIAQLTDDNKKLKDRLTALGADASKSEADLADAKKQVEALKKAQALAEARVKQFNELRDKLKAMLSSGNLQVEIRNGLMLVKLADNILFDPGKTELKKEGKDAIKQLAGVLKDIPNRKFQIAGHTDNVALKGGRYKDNWELSTARAVEVLRFMVKDGGMPVDRVSAAGWADQMPVAPNDSDEHKKQNRRIEIVLLPNMEDLPPMQDQQ